MSTVMKSLLKKLQDFVRFFDETIYYAHKCSISVSKKFDNVCYLIVDDNMLSSDFLFKLSEIHSYSVFQGNGVFEIQFMLDD